jgi:hypothetical protein
LGFHGLLLLWKISKNTTGGQTPHLLTVCPHPAAWSFGIHNWLVAMVSFAFGSHPGLDHPTPMAISYDCWPGSSLPSSFILQQTLSGHIRQPGNIYLRQLGETLTLPPFLAEGFLLTYFA